MNTLTKIILAPLTLAVTTLSTQSVQAFTYTFSNSAPCNPFFCTGNVDVMGTIETDGTLGTIALANIVNWELVFNSPNYTNTIISPSNGEIVNTGVNLIATETEITFDLPGNIGSGFIDFQFRDIAPFPSDVSYFFVGGGTDSRVSITNSPRTVFGDPFDQGQVTLFGGEGGTVVLATREAQTTPEPSSLLGLLLMSSAGFLVKKRQK